MTSTSEVGISPVLLQAITQTLSTASPDRHTKVVKERSGGGGGGGGGQAGPQQVIVSCDSSGQIAAPTHILHGMNEPVTSYTTTSPSGETIVVVQNLDVAGEEQVELQPEQVTSPSKPQIIIKNIAGCGGGGGVKEESDSPPPAPPSAPPHHQQEQLRQSFPVIVSQGQELHMSNVLSAIATHLKNNRKRPRPSLTEDEESSSSAVGVDLSVESSSEVSTHPQPIYISFPESTQVPSPANDVTVNEDDGVVTETVVHSVQSGSEHTTQHYVPIKRLRPASLAEQAAGGGGAATTFVLNTDALPPGTVYQTMQTEQGTFAIAQVASADSPQGDGELGKPCPICGDRISGYHYGIYTCESCKGFFKRTVQNKKAFICHRKGDCLINMTSRKKCPACRFKRCLVHGMRLEAIREDRMRGGRSSYEGCSPHGRPKTGSSSVSAPRVKEEAARRKVVHITPVSQPSTSREGSLEVSQGETVVTSGSGVEQVITVVNINPDPELVEEQHEVEGGTNQRLDVSAGMVPQTPQTLEDLLAVETLMADDEEEQPCCRGKLRAGDEDLFGSLLHLADHCLYRIVRWARNLPDFANVSTEDQILLLQSCWAELLCLSVCWNSIRSQNNTLLLSHGRELNLEMAKAMGFAEVIQRLLDFTEHLRRLEMDLHEYISLKVLMLMTPDVKNLKNEDVIRDYQERICEALLVYSITHYPNLPNKHCELLCRLTELTRTCSLAKDLLNARMASGEVPPFSLLSELLKGDIIVQPSE